MLCDDRGRLKGAADGGLLSVSWWDVKENDALRFVTEWRRGATARFA